MDDEVNNKKANVLQDGAWKLVAWKFLKVGVLVFVVFKFSLSYFYSFMFCISEGEFIARDLSLKNFLIWFCC
jgi:hypothetical protein